MIAIVRIALSRPYTFVVMAVLILIFGVLSAVRTPTDILPNIGIPVVAAVWTYNGMSPDDMSGRVVYYYERTLSAQVNDISHIESQSMFGYGVVKIFFQPTVNINSALAQVTAASQTVLKLLPPGITPPYVLSFNASSVPILQLALSSHTLSQTRLFDYGQNFIRPQLATVEGAAIPSPYGGKVRQIQIDLDQHALQGYGLAAEDVVAALAQQNLITPVGTEKIGTFEWNVALNDAPQEYAELEDLPVKRVNGTVVYMRDVAHIRDGSPPQTNVVHVDGTHAVLMTILKSGAASTLDIIAHTKALLPQIKASLPPSLDLKAVGDQSVFVTSAVMGVIREGVIAATLTGLMILVFLGSWRSTLIITISIPLAILFSVIVLSVLGETINVMTLGGLALAVGILVDDATVTIENINYHLEMGKPVQDAILDGARQIVVPATVSLLCICIVFVPMFGLGGVAGYLFRPLAEAVVFAMIGSYLLSRTLVPTLANFLLQRHVHHHGPAPRGTVFTRFQRGFEARFEALRRGYEGILVLALTWRARTVVGFFAIVLLSFGLVPFLGRNFFPAVESNQIKLHVRAQTGTRIEDVAALCGQVEQLIRARIIPPAHLDTIVDNIGMPVSGINLAYGNSGAIGVGDADILISLKGAVATDYERAMREILPRAFPGTVFSLLPPDIISQIINFGLPAPIDLQIVGNDLPADRAYANALLARLRRVPGVADARIQQAFNEPTLRVNLDRSLASLVGLTEKDAATSMLDTLAGSIQTAPTFWLNPHNGVSYPIVVQTPQYDIDTMSNLQNLPMSSAGGSAGSMQLLGGLAAVRTEASNAVVSHYNVRPVIDIYATPQERDLGSVAAAINTIVAGQAHALPRGSQVTLRGQVSTMTEAYSQLIIGLAFAIVLIYLLIVVNFQSWVDPAVIVLGLPGALAGIVWMLFLTGTTVSVPALTGAIMCMGVATANSILVISFARERMATGMDAVQAAMEAGATRFRPVLMTALAMIIGMAPTALSAEQNAPLGRAVIGGLMLATLATLFVVPTLFSLAHRGENLGEPRYAGKPGHGR
jgi:multidrug efflux pump subunit AcrB